MISPCENLPLGSHTINPSRTPDYLRYNLWFLFPPVRFLRRRKVRIRVQLYVLSITDFPPARLHPRTSVCVVPVGRPNFRPPPLFLRDAILRIRNSWCRKFSIGIFPHPNLLVWLPLETQGKANLPGFLLSATIGPKLVSVLLYWQVGFSFVCRRS